MEIKKQNNKVVVTYTLKRGESYRIQDGGKFNSITFIKKPKLIKGFSNSTEDGKAILTIDYDNVLESVVIEDYMLIQHKFKLPPAYLFKTKDNNWHVICLKKFCHPQIFNILSYTRCDSNYITMPLRNPYRNYVLRLSSKKGSKKPKFVKLIGLCRNLGYPVSNPHEIMLSKLYPKLKHPNYRNIDKCHKIFVQEYECK